MNDEQRDHLTRTRFRRPAAIAAAAASRTPRPVEDATGQLLIVAADHTARGVISVGDHPSAMANRYDLLDRLVVALADPGVDGVLGTPDIIEDLLLLGALEGKMVFGSMNRGGIPGSVFELDDRFGAFRADAIADFGYEGGKMLLRINYDDVGTASTLSACAAAVDELASRGRIAMIEPFMNQTVDGRPRNVLTPDAVIRSMAISSALGSTSAYTWLKVPVVEDMARVVEATTLPIVLLGGDRHHDPDEMFRSWEEALRLPGVRGLTVGRNLLYPADDDVAGAVKIAASLK